ncbi:hypothetical protein CspeluHIS016_0501440 [Cutaneotrichosporon spelunceum]|uniref:Uncharacterized protein n=1 Tax=Cutaneotrichosporon spelunceum TaxID=1672016 RepID=A0AAD3TWF8_9TREE|nr:hypothetical protein CspeluHIS016_0501440 [Cutaneotrichosporon spelunceum]
MEIPMFHMDDPGSVDFDVDMDELLAMVNGCIPQSESTEHLLVSRSPGYSVSRVSETFRPSTTPHHPPTTTPSPTPGRADLPPSRTPKKTPGKRTSKTSLKKTSSSSYLRPPSRAESDVEGPSKARILRKAKSKTFRPSEERTPILGDLIDFTLTVSPEEYRQMGFGYDFRSAFWRAFTQQNVYAAPLHDGTSILQQFKTQLENVSLYFAAGYQIPKQKDPEMLLAFEEYLPTYPWGDPIVRKSDVQVAFEKSAGGQKAFEAH